MAVCILSGDLYCYLVQYKPREKLNRGRLQIIDFFFKITIKPEQHPIPAVLQRTDELSDVLWLGWNKRPQPAPAFRG